MEYSDSNNDYDNDDYCRIQLWKLRFSIQERRRLVWKLRRTLLPPLWVWLLRLCLWRRNVWVLWMRPRSMWMCEVCGVWFEHHRTSWRLRRTRWRRLGAPLFVWEEVSVHLCAQSRLGNNWFPPDERLEEMWRVRPPTRSLKLKAKRSRGRVSPQFFFNIELLIYFNIEYSTPYFVRSENWNGFMPYSGM